jgi:hypothetical protein
MNIELPQNFVYVIGCEELRESNHLEDLGVDGRIK